MSWEPRRKGIMLCYPFEEKRLNKWQPPYLVQPKLDGERCRAICKDGEWTLLSSEENEINSVPHIVAQLERAFGQNLNIELDGELYTHDLPFEEIHSRVGRTVNLHPEFFNINYNIFDIVEDEPQLERLYHLAKLLPESSDCLERVYTEVTSTLEEVLNAYDGFLKDDYEGMVVRHFAAPYVRKRSTYMMKFKPKKSDFYKIISINEEVDKYGEPKHRLGAFTCCGDDGMLFNVGTGMTEEERERWWDTKVIGKWLHVSYQHITPGRHVPRFPVYVEVCDDELTPIESL